MIRVVSIALFVSVGFAVGCLSLHCACIIAIRIGGRLGDTVRNGDMDTVVVTGYWMIGMLISSILNIMFGWLAVSGFHGRPPDHAFYIMALLIMFTLPFLAACLGMVLLAS